MFILNYMFTIRIMSYQLLITCNFLLSYLFTMIFKHMVLNFKQQHGFNYNDFAKNLELPTHNFQKFQKFNF